MHAPQTLLVDADDTLWENNIYFEQAIASFLSLLDHTPHTAVQVRDRLDAIERETVAEHGYGTHSFERSLRRCYGELSGRQMEPGDESRIRGFAQSIAEAEIALLPGVADWLPRLAERHQLILVTKGDQAEQAGKLGRSQLAPFFGGVEILREKNQAAYEELQRRRTLTPGATWMLGNSPRSDINPAMAAGFHTAYIRYHSTWVLEEEALRQPAPGQQLLVCNTFAEAAAYLLAD